MKLINSGLFLQQRIKSGDIKAFETLFRENYAPLCRFAKSFVNDTDTAEEIVQDFFYHFWKNKETIQVKISLKAYLFGSVKNLAIKHIEKQIVRRKYAERILAESPDSNWYNFENELDAKELKNKIEQSLELLPDRCRLIFRLNRFEGLTYQKIAEALSVSVKTVEADMTRTLKHIRSTLSELEKIPEVQGLPKKEN